MTLWGGRRPIFGGPKRWFNNLNSSVLTKMPRDYTDPNCLTMYSPRSARVSHTMQKKKNVKKVSRSGPKSRKQQSARTESRGGVPAAYNVVRVTGVPRMVTKPSNDARVVIKHQEYLTPVNGSTTELTTMYNINPGLDNIFPWLSGIARNYESYQWKSLQFEYVPQVGTQTKGRVMMAADYDARDAVVSTYRRLGSMHGAVTGSIWSVVRLACDSADLSKSKQYYVRSAAVPSGTDIKTYDTLSLMVNVGGTVDTAVYGDIRVSYVVELMTPQVQSDEEFDLSKKITNPSATAAAPFGAGVVVTGGLDIAPESTSQLRFDKIGEYLLSGNFTGTGVTPGAQPTWTTSSGAATILNEACTTDGGALNNVFDQTIRVTSAPWVAAINLLAATVTAVTLRFAKYDSHL